MSNMNTPVTTGENVDWMKRIRNENMATASRTINREQENVIKKLEEALIILRQIEIKNEDSFDIINEPLDDFLSKLKYLPTDPPFDILPTEIKTNIFSYLCDSGAFVTASVCLEWKEIMKTTLKKMDEVKIGVHCSNEYKCEYMDCLMPVEILKASITLKSGVPLSLCHRLQDVDSKLIAEGLASASSLSVKGKCVCRGNDDDEYEDEDIDIDDQILTKKQFKELFKALDRKSDIMNSLKLLDLDLTWLDQNRLTNVLLSVTRSLTLDEGEFGTILNVRKFVQKLSQVSEDSHELRELKIHHLDYTDASFYRMADALCNVYTVQLCPEFHLEIATIKRLFENILTRPIAIRNLGIYENIDYRTLIEPDDLKTLLGKMWMVSLWGVFTPEQLKVVRFLPGVEASLDGIYKIPIMDSETADLYPTEEQLEGGDGVEDEAEDGLEGEDEDGVEDKAKDGSEGKDKDGVEDEDDEQPN